MLGGFQKDRYPAVGGANQKGYSMPFGVYKETLVTSNCMGFCFYGLPLPTAECLELTWVIVGYSLEFLLYRKSQG